MRYSRLILILVLTLTALITPTNLRADTPTPTPEKKLIPFGPVKAVATINKQGTQCNVTSENPDELKKFILDNYGVSFVDSGWNWTPRLLKIACGKFAEISKTTFFSALNNGSSGPYNNPIVVRANSVCPAFGQVVPCRSGARLIEMMPRTVNYSDDLFKVVLLHEIAHDLQFQKEEFSRAIEHLQARFSEGYVTGYGNPATNCNLGTPPDGEDYAEMITYYLNPDSASQTIGCASGPNPYQNGSHPLHFQVARQILGDFP